MMFNTALMEVHAENSFKEQGSLLIDIFRLYCVNISFLSIIILINNYYFIEQYRRK